MIYGKKHETQSTMALLASAAFFVTTSAQAQIIEPESILTDEVVDTAVTDNSEEDVIVVTGTNIRNAVPTFNAITFSKLDIEKSGATSVEQYLRRLPQSGVRADPTVGPIISGQGGGRTGRASGIDLRGLGAQNTLVLVNGRRLASSSNNDTGTGVGIFTDISSIPLSAVDRIEIVTEGASAIYGADAVGGVINIILLSDYKGGTTKLRYGDSSTGLDDFSAEQTLGFNIGKLSSLLSFSYRRESRGDPDRLQSFSQDDFARFGVSSAISEFFNTGSPAVARGLTPICDIGNGPEDCFFTDFEGFLGNRFFDFPNASQITFPSGLGRAPTLDDALINAPGNGEVFDPVLSPGLDEFAASANFDYEFSDKTKLRAGGFVSYRESEGTSAAPTINAFLPFGHPNNPFFEDVDYSYNLFREVEEGLIERPGFESETLTYSVNLGLTHEFKNEWQLRVDGNFSRDENTSVTNSLFLDFDALDVIEFDFDPATAVNPFGPGLYASSEFLQTLLRESSVEAENKTFQLTAAVDGPLFKVAAGDVRIALGGEFRGERFDFDQEALEDPFTGDINSEFCINNAIDCDFVFVDAEEDRDIYSAFAELNVPLISADMNVPLVEELSLTGAARYDRYEDIETRDRVSPSAGVRLKVNDNLQFRANYAESFRAPNIASLSALNLVDTTGFIGFEDPQLGNQFVFPETVVTGGNPNLEDETGTSISVGGVFETGIGPGHFRLNVNYFNNRIQNQIGAISVAAQRFIFENSDAFPEFVQRDEFGNVTRFNDISINIANVDVEGYDINANYDFRLDNYDIDLNVAYTNNIQNDEEILEGIGELESFLGTDLGPESYSLVSKIEVSRGTLFNAGAIGRYHPSYTYEAQSLANANDFFADPETFSVDGQLLVDVFASVNLEEINDSLEGFRLSFGANNLFDPQPNFYGNNPLGLNFGRGAEVRGRVAYVELSKTF